MFRRRLSQSVGLSRGGGHSEEKNKNKNKEKLLPQAGESLVETKRAPLSLSPALPRRHKPILINVAVPIGPPAARNESLNETALARNFQR